jgi:hypothetical protein
MKSIKAKAIAARPLKIPKEKKKTPKAGNR